VGLCTANQGDIIYVMPGHAEAITAATSFVCDIAGIKIKGLGHGSNTPTLTFTTAAAATISVTAPSVTFENIRMVSAFTDGITTGITVGALADGFELKKVRMEESLSTQEFLVGVSVAAACHDVTIDGFDFFGVDGGTDSSAIYFVGASNYSTIRNFRIYGDFSGAAIDALTAKSLYMTIEKGLIVNVDTAAGLSVSVKSDTTGFMSDLRIAQILDTIGPAGAAMAYSEVYVTNALGVQGIYKPAVDA
jgi:hypothetical protein